jgi:hypothetical protein
MFKAKDLVINPISSSSARAMIGMYHYSGKSTMNSQIHFGVFLNGTLQGALQYGPSIDKRRMASNLGIGFNESLELNRMALSDKCPKNSESRSISITLRMLKKKYSHLRVIISFADACQCGDGTIYKASGFKLHSFKKNNTLYIGPNGDVIADKTLNDRIPVNGKSQLSIYKEKGYKPLKGYQFKYLYFFDKDLEKRFRFVDFDKIPDSVKMYKGKNISTRDEHENNVDGFQLSESGATPTIALHFKDSERDHITL